MKYKDLTTTTITVKIEPEDDVRFGPPLSELDEDEGIDEGMNDTEGEVESEESEE